MNTNKYEFFVFVLQSLFVFIIWKTSIRVQIVKASIHIFVFIYIPSMYIVYIIYTGITYGGSTYVVVAG